MPRTEAIYQALPVPLQHLACSTVGWWTRRERYTHEFPRLLASAQERTLWSPPAVRAYRDLRLQAFVRHAAETVPYYRDWFAAAEVSPSDVKSLDDLTHLPVVSKQDVQRDLAMFISDAAPRRGRRTIHTSGTTGAGLRFPTTIAAIREQWAVWWRYRSWHGLVPGTWCGYFGGRSVVPMSQRRPPFWRYNWPGRQLLFSGYHMNPTFIPAYVTALRRRQPPWLHGYPSLLVLLAEHLLTSGESLGYQVRWITTGAENLSPHQAASIQRAFGVAPLEHYGLAEAVANISQCDRGALHVDEDFAATEFVPLPRAQQRYRIVGTNFTNLALPLLRYDTGDVVTLEPDQCGCGRPGRTVTHIDGRREDYVVLRDGSYVGRTDHIFKDMLNIREAQIYQGEPGKITIRVVPRDGYSHTDEELLLREAQHRLGTDMRIAIQYVDAVERSSAGKLRLVVSNLPGASVGAGDGSAQHR